jgi:hypothetical protein
LTLLFLAAPANLRSAAAASHFSVAWRSHFFKNEVLAAPASFLSRATELQVGSGDCAKVVVLKAKLASSTPITVWIDFITFILFGEFGDCGSRHILVQCGNL